MPETDAPLGNTSAGIPSEPPQAPTQAVPPAQKPVYQGLAFSLPTRNGEGFTIANDLRNTDPERKTILLTRRTSEGILEEREIPRTTYERILGGMEAKAAKKGTRFPPKEKTALLARDEVLTLDGKELRVRDYDASKRGYFVRVLTPNGTYDETFVERADLDRVTQDHRGTQVLTSEERDQLRKRIFREKQSVEEVEKKEKVTRSPEPKKTNTGTAAPLAETRASAPPTESPAQEEQATSSPLRAPLQAQTAIGTEPSNESSPKTASAWIERETPASEAAPNQSGSEERPSSEASPKNQPPSSQSTGSERAATSPSSRGIEPAANATTPASLAAQAASSVAAGTAAFTSPTIATAAAGAAIAGTAAVAASAVAASSTSGTQNAPAPTPTPLPPSTQELSQTIEPTIRETRAELRREQAGVQELNEAKRFFTQRIQRVRPQTSEDSGSVETRWEEALRATEAEFPEVNPELLREALKEVTSPTVSFRTNTGNVAPRAPSVSPIPVTRGLGQGSNVAASSDSSSLQARSEQAETTLRARIVNADEALAAIREKRQQYQQAAQELTVSLVQLDPASPEHLDVQTELDELREESLVLSQEEAMTRALSLELAAQASELSALASNAFRADFRQPGLNQALEEKLATLPTPSAQPMREAASAPQKRAASLSPETRTSTNNPPSRNGLLERLRHRVARPMLLMGALAAGQAEGGAPRDTDHSTLSDTRVESGRSRTRSSQKQNVGRYDTETGELMAHGFDEEAEPLSFADQTEAMVDTQRAFSGASDSSDEDAEPALDDAFSDAVLEEGDPSSAQTETEEERPLSEEERGRELLQNQLQDQLKNQLKDQATSAATKQATQQAGQEGAKQLAKQFLNNGGNQLLKTAGWYLIPILFVWLNIRLLAPKEGSAWREPLTPLGQLGIIVFDLIAFFLFLLQLALTLVILYGPILLIGGTIGTIFRVLSWVAG